MSTFWFVLAALALIGAVVLMYLGRRRPQPVAQTRAEWARIRGLDHVEADPGLASRWRRGVFEEYPEAQPIEVAQGLLDGSQMYVMDLRVDTPHQGPGPDETHVETVVCLQRPIGSPVVFDLRSETSPAPAEDEVHILGAVGRFFAFSDDLGVARRVCDRRMVTFAEAAPECVDALWSDGDWTFAWLAAGASPDDWDDAIASLSRFTALLRVLPPDRARMAPGAAIHDPGSPRL